MKQEGSTGTVSLQVIMTTTNVPGVLVVRLEQSHAKPQQPRSGVHAHECREANGAQVPGEHVLDGGSVLGSKADAADVLVVLLVEPLVQQRVVQRAVAPVEGEVQEQQCHNELHRQIVMEGPRSERTRCWPARCIQTQYKSCFNSVVAPHTSQNTVRVDGSGASVTVP